MEIEVKYLQGMMMVLLILQILKMDPLFVFIMILDCLKAHDAAITKLFWMEDK